MADKVYPSYKKVIWRYVRVFVSGFISVIIIYFTPFIRALSEEYKTLLVGALTAGFVAVGKAIREEWGTQYPILRKITLI